MWPFKKSVINGKEIPIKIITSNLVNCVGGEVNSIRYSVFEEGILLKIKNYHPTVVAVIGDFQPVNEHKRKAFYLEIDMLDGSFDTFILYEPYEIMLKHREIVYYAQQNEVLFKRAISDAYSGVGISQYVDLDKFVAIQNPQSSQSSLCSESKKTITSATNLIGKKS